MNLFSEETVCFGFSTGNSSAQSTLNLRGGCQWSKFGGTNDLGSLVAYPRPLPTLMIMVQKICAILGTCFFFGFFL